MAQKLEGPMNRLSREKSPYLLQHAHNPVDWYPWGEEAFAKARAEEKPIFLSVGYATCHWCHVMAHECFEDQAIARLLNQFFVPVKVDREERPDVDQVYMTACQALTGRGGWPLSVFLTPDGKPFFAGTYFPKVSRMGLPGFGELLLHIANLWRTDKPKVIKAASEVAQTLNQLHQASQQTAADTLDIKLLRRAYEGLSRTFDTRFGGFGQAPKFPTPHQLYFLLRWHARGGPSSALEMVNHTLRNMRWGGIFDQVGFGFHRYSVDERWLVPHFEKMLYDQALLLMAYCELYQVTQESMFARVAREIAQYVLDNLRESQGGFHCAEDADTQGKEGAFYTWRPDEVRAALGEELGDLMCQLYGITHEGNFEEGVSIAHMPMEPGVFASRQGMTLEQLENLMERGRLLLLEARSRRPRPFKDDKILSGWNGLMVAALARASWVLDEPSYVRAAAAAASFVLGAMRDKRGLLFRRWRHGEAAQEGCLEDYAAMVWGALELYEATFEVDWLEKALEMTGMMLDLFWDEKKGGFFFTSKEAEQLISRPKEAYDGAIPSGNSMAAMNLARLGRMLGKPELEERAWATLRAFSGSLTRAPVAHTHMLLALDLLLGPTQEVVIAGDLDQPSTAEMLKELRKGFNPRRVLLLKDKGEKGNRLAHLAPYVLSMEPGPSGARVYLCEGNSCREPLSNPRELEAALHKSPLRV